MSLIACKNIQPVDLTFPKCYAIMSETNGKCGTHRTIAGARSHRFGFCHALQCLRNSTDREQDLSSCWCEFKSRRGLIICSYQSDIQAAVINKLSRNFRGSAFFVCNFSYERRWRRRFASAIPALAWFSGISESLERCCVNMSYRFWNARWILLKGRYCFIAINVI